MVLLLHPVAGDGEYRKREGLARSLGTMLAEHGSRRGFSRSDMHLVSWGQLPTVISGVSSCGTPVFSASMRQTPPVSVSLERKRALYAIFGLCGTQ